MQAWTVQNNQYSMKLAWKMALMWYSLSLHHDFEKKIAINVYFTHRVSDYRGRLVSVGREWKMIQKIGQGRWDCAIVFGRNDDKPSRLLYFCQGIGHPWRSQALIRHEVQGLFQQRSIQCHRICNNYIQSSPTTSLYIRSTGLYNYFTTFFKKFNRP